MADKILVVDDEQETMEYIVMTLKKEGFQAIGTTTAEEALDIANRESPDLIISDLKMPVMDGVELCWMIRVNSEIPMVPFIFLSGYSDEELQINGFRAGADDYLIKPIQKSKLLEVAKTLIERYKKVKEVGYYKEAGISGKTSEISQIEILQLLTSSRKTGVFIISHKGTEGKIYLKDGRIIDAELGIMKGLEAANLIISNMEGNYRFNQQPVNREEVINLPAIKVIMEACKIIDESAKKNKE